MLALVGPTGADAAVRLTMGASLGRLRHHWTMDLVVEAGTTELVVVDIPREAFLDDLARTYVTQLRVDVWDGVATDRVPVVWLAWPGGPEHEPAVWDDRELRERAPHGVVDPALDAQLAGQFDEPFWVSPPMPRDDGPETPYDGARESTEAQP